MNFRLMMSKLNSIQIGIDWIGLDWIMSSSEKQIFNDQMMEKNNSNKKKKDN